MPPRYPFPCHPTGWFALATSSELRPGAVLTRALAGEELVLFRDGEGRASALDAYCPHLGAHLGHCGDVESGALRCSFHGFRFDGEGACVATGYGTRPPPKARLRRFHAMERNGFVLVWHDAAGRAPDWEVPVLDERGFSAPQVHRFTLRGHPQETTENSVDVGHLALVHGYREVRTVVAPSARGAYLHARYAMRRFVGVGARLGFDVGTDFDVHVHGLGYSLVELRLPRYGLRLRQHILATPTSGDQIDLRISVSAARPSWSPAALPVASLIARGVMRMFRHDVAQDFAIWTHKRYVEAPALAAGDGPIALYRRWARQFYPEAAANWVPARELASR